jgi:hypothetical protein
MRENGHHRIARFDFERRRNGQRFAAFRLRDDARAADQFYVFAGTAIGDGRFIGIDLDNGIVHAQAGEGGKDMLDGLNFDVAPGERGRTIRFRNVFDARFNFRFVIKIDAAEADAGIGRGREERHVHPVAAMQADARITDRAAQGLLLQHGRS